MKRRRLRVRTSTLVLIALLIGTAALYLAIRPSSTSNAPTAPPTTLAR